MSRRRQRTAREILDASASEAQLTRTVIEMAEWLGWRAYHVTDSRKDTVYGETGRGFLDILAIRPGRLIVAELKDEDGDMSDDQREWMALWQTIPGVETYQWRPRDTDRIKEILGGGSE